MHPTEMGVSNSYTHFPVGIRHIIRFRIGYIDIVMFVEVYAAWLSKLSTLGNKASTLIKYLQTIVSTISYENTTALIDGQTV